MFVVTAFAQSMAYMRTLGLVARNTRVILPRPLNLGSVQNNVLGTTHDLKVLWSVISTITVDVVNNLRPLEMTPKFAFGNQSMFKNVGVFFGIRMFWCVDDVVPILAKVTSTLPRLTFCSRLSATRGDVALTRAELTPALSDLGRDDREYISACLTGTLEAHRNQSFRCRSRGCLQHRSAFFVPIFSPHFTRYKPFDRVLGRA